MPFALQAQSVEDLINMAYEYNPGLKSLKLDYESSLQRANQVNDWPDPTVNIAVGVFPIETRLGAQRFKIGASQMIPWKGALDAKSDVAKSIAQVQSNADDIQKINIEYAIRTAYATLQLLESKKKLIAKRLEIIDVLQELSKSAVRSGKGKLSNVLLTERKREMLVADLSLIDKKIEQPTIAINRWSGRSLEEKVIISSGSEILLSKTEVTAFAHNKHPKLKVYENQIEASNARITLMKFDSKPKFGVGLDYAFIDRREDVDIEGNGRDVLIPMASISIPIHKGRYDAIRQEENIKQQSINAQKEEFQDMLKAEIEYAYSTIEYTDQVIKKNESLKNITKETLQLMRTEYASEGTRFEELMRLEMELIDYDLDILLSQYERDIAISTLYKFK